MNFFEAQERSRRTSRQLVLMMVLAVVCVCASVALVVCVAAWSMLLTNSMTAGTSFPRWLQANPQVPFWALVYTAGFIGVASLYRIIRLRSGGGEVAREMGGTLLDSAETDPLRRRLRNVVEETAIAAGIPAPEIYVLEHEPGINAFAAGYAPEDAAIAVTRGTLELLSRDELQGVVAHEFSHILNGDMRLNIKLMGPLFGVLAIGLLGRLVLSNTRVMPSRNGRSNAVPVVLAIGGGLTAVGFVGMLAGRLIKAGVSRQREYLADASAVQFTRQRDGIAGALKKIAGLNAGSALRAHDAEEVSHMLFASGLSSINGWLATHPPLLKRIQALDPGFTAAQMSALVTPADGLHTSRPPAAGAAGLAGHATAASVPGAGELIASVGQPGDRQYALARELYAAIPAAIANALDSEYGVLLLLPALLLQHDDAERELQLQLLERQLGAERRATIAGYYAALSACPGEIRLPLLDLALPRLRRQPLPRLEYMKELLDQLAAANARLDLFEYAVLRIYGDYLERIREPAAVRRWRGLDNPRMAAAARTLLQVFTAHGCKDADAAQRALETGMAALGMVLPADAGIPADWVRATDAALATLRHSTPKARERLATALAAAALEDRHISQPESELLRCFCAILQCPLPPFLPYRATPT
ncbi:MAG: M48 family metallopeptidase [Gammaproteobacteria bacterium]|jgi:Zn-dependent protease with chaperone function|nr:M48 family metallopeptidase [Gammaproteobacteria bacterium]